MTIILNIDIVLLLKVVLLGAVLVGCGYMIATIRANSVINAFIQDMIGCGALDERKMRLFILQQQEKGNM